VDNDKITSRPVTRAYARVAMFLGGASLWFLYTKTVRHQLNVEALMVVLLTCIPIACFAYWQKQANLKKN
jgi:hypothetical protein